ncbi:response regulator [Hymenobacter sp. B1770]|uniref:response regulator n=1 Tax=Hymenobacter sp. B1770 TaxID=1718788 RepID=UPI003CF6F55B
MRTVLIDDDATAVFLTKRLFQREGLGEGLAAFVSPVEAVAALQEQALTGTLPHVILLDLNMPVMGGWDVLEALQPLEPHLRGRCAVYILTSSVSPADTNRAREYPLVVKLLHKPLDQAKIQAIQAQLPK